MAADETFRVAPDSVRETHECIQIDGYHYCGTNDLERWSAALEYRVH